MDHFCCKYRVLTGSIFAGTAGLLGFSGYLALLTCVTLLAVALHYTTRWYQAWFIAFIYFTCASHDLFLGIFNFTQGHWLLSVCLPVAANALIALPFVCVPKFRCVGLVAAIILITIPPLGQIGWANPITAAGTLIPGLGFLSIGLFILAFCLIFIKPKFAFAIPIFSLLTLIIPIDPTTENNHSIQPVQTSLGALMTAKLDYHLDYQVQSELMQQPFHNVDFVVYPESALGRISAPAVDRWQRYAMQINSGLIGGTERPLNDQALSNAMIYVDQSHFDVVYEARVNVPYFMQRNEPGFFRNQPGQGIFHLKGSRYGGLICYEAFITWPMLVTAFYNPQAMFIISNLWWAEHTRLVEILNMISRAWQRTFNIPLYLSVNNP